MNGKVILLTGAPATGKTTLSRLLKESLQRVETIDYGKLLLIEKQKDMPELTYDELRAKSSMLISAKDVASMDERLIKWVNDNRKETHILIDTHGVTKESYGFRLTPFHYWQVIDLRLTAVFSLYCDPDIIQKRIGRKSEGRPQVNEQVALKHSQLQDGIASLYGVLCGCPVYYLNSSVSAEELCNIALKILREDLQIND